MEQIVFPIPEICEYLTNDTKIKIFNTAERDDQGSKVADFFDRADEMFNEMKWQKKLRGQPALFWVSSYMTLWSNVLFNSVVLINCIVAFFYPFDKSIPGKHHFHLDTLEYLHKTFNLTNTSLLHQFRIKHTPVAADLGDNTDLHDNRFHGAAHIWHTHASCIDNIANDIFYGTGTDVMAAGIANGDAKRRAYR